jgi:hypothetical protein
MELGVTFAAKAATNLQRFCAAQKPSDFASLFKLADQEAHFVAAGNIDMSPLKATFVEWLMGKSTDPKLRAAVDEMYSQWTGEVAIAGMMRTPTDMTYEYLMGVKDPKRAAEVFPRTLEVFTGGGNGAFAGMMKVERKPRPPFQYDGLTVSQSDLRYDFSGMSSTVYKGPKEMKTAMAWTGWDNFLTTVLAPSPAEPIKRLIDAARHQKAALSLDAAARASLERARAAKESMWLRIDFGKFSAAATAAAQPVAMPKVTPIITIGFNSDQMKVRIGVPPR